MQHFHWLDDPSLQRLFAATRAAGGEARVIGGAVRDFIAERPMGDIDMASSLRPEATMALAKAEGWKAIPTGIAYGTVTLILPTQRVEITTLRRDVATDGRHATVAYTDCWEEDAARRDFTMNAMSMDDTGQLHDYYEGGKDTLAGRVRFIGDASRRIEEDALRMLRFFRFLATHGTPPADADALAAITAHAARGRQLSGERIAQEMRKLLAAPAPAFALRLMAQTGLDAVIFPRPIDPRPLIRLQLLEQQASSPASVFARALLLLGPADGATMEADRAWLTQRWKLARKETSQIALLQASLTEGGPLTQPNPLRSVRLHGLPYFTDALLMQAVQGQGVDVAAWMTRARAFVPPMFPIAAEDLLTQGYREGKALGEALRRLEKRWEESGYQLEKDALLALAAREE